MDIATKTYRYCAPMFARLFPLILAAVLCACGKANSAASAPPAGAKPGASVREVVIATPTAHPWPRSVVLHGTLEARERVQLAARVAGPIGRLKADLGDAFPANTVLAQIESAQILAELAQADAELENARGQLARIDAIHSPEAVSRREADEARTRAATADAKQQVAAQRVKDLRIVAPFAGTVARRYVSLGAFVKVGDPLFDFVSTGPLRLALEVPERFLNDVVVGTRVRIEPRDVPTDGRADDAQAAGTDAEIVRVSPALNEKTRTLRVEALVDAETTPLRPGTFVLSTIALGTVEDAMQLPRTAVYSMLGQDRVTVIDADGKAAYRDVDLVGEHDGFAYVRGVTGTDRVVAQSGATIPPGSSVKVAQAKASP